MSPARSTTTSRRSRRGPTSATSASPRSPRARRRDDQRPPGRSRPGLPGLGRPAAGQARAAAPGLSAGRAEALQRAPRRPLNLQPRYFPVSGDDAAKLIIAVDVADGSDAAMGSPARSCAASGSRSSNIADPAVLQSMLETCGLPPAPARRLAVAGGARALRAGLAAGDRRRRVRRAELRGRRRDVLGPGPARLRRAPPGRRLTAALLHACTSPWPARRRRSWRRRSSHRTSRPRPCSRLPACPWSRPSCASVDLHARLGVGLGPGHRGLGFLDADVLVVAGLVVAALLGDLVVGFGDLVRRRARAPSACSCRPPRPRRRSSCAPPWPRRRRCPWRCRSCASHAFLAVS